MGSFVALFSSLLWGSADFFAGLLAKRYRALAVTGASQAFGLLFGVVVIAFSGNFIRPTLAMDGYFLPGIFAGIAGFIGLSAFYTGLATGRMGVVSPISSLSVIIPLVVALAQGEKPNRLQIFGIAVAIIGAFLASGPELRGGFPIRPLVFAVIAALSFGTALSFLAVGSRTDALHTMVAMRCGSVTIAIALALRYRTLGGFQRTVIPQLFFIGVADFLGNFFLGIATTKGLVSVAMVLGSLFPIVTALLAYRLLHERLHKSQYVGIVVAILGIISISIA